jgi:cytochrome c-type biogenesis protein CcmH
MQLAPARADLPAMLGEVLVIQAGGTVTPDARALFQRALSADRAQAAARYYLARARIADGDVAGGLTQWRGLLASLPAGDDRRASLADQIAAVQKTGALPAAAEAPAPPAGDVSRAIRGMVDGLAARLAARPDDPDGWVRLVRAWAVLGETAKRDQAAADARARFAGRQDVLRQIDAAARTPAAAGPIG